ncbi:hypothetical protein [Acetanaerobacterium elongatum]|uniref:Uncharacterized protein n=1 Tax=Acetanaerobacterium elongatum TaxID=258515 RepID=A0A1G9Z0I0_9FIRM|nr:hypothetical protein [Acetanaerobacterium elongatum]SDN14301.1 hypothetical protein SAMN05192585_11232 [Acetanaerobacterium elongatum]
MNNELVDAYITLMILVGWILLLTPLVCFIMALFPGDLLERIRYGKRVDANTRYGRPRNLKVDRQVFSCKTDAVRIARNASPSVKAVATSWPDSSKSRPAVKNI